MKRGAQPRVSIITPLYNNASDLSECINSILAQTYDNWDCVIVNNCSSDDSAQVARRFAAMDGRIRVHDNADFLPPIANHNAALRLMSADSKYCKIVFADDWIFPECLERMVAVAEAHRSVGIVGAYVLEGDDVTCTGLPYPSTVVDGRDVCRSHLLLKFYVFGSPNSLLYRADLVRHRDPFFNEDNIHADTEVCFPILKHFDFGFVHQVLTATRVREGSLRTKSLEIQTGLAGWLELLLLHGRDFLSESELTMLLDGHLSGYYRFLGKSLLLGQSDEFWSYHRSKLNRTREGFSRVRLMRGVADVVVDAALNPKRTIEQMRAHIGGRRRGLDPFAALSEHRP